VSAFQKLFLATAILGTGLAVAVLLGQPVGSKTVTGLPASPASQPFAVAAPIAPPAALNSVSSAKLLPDADAASKTTSLLDAPALLPPLAPVATFSNPSPDPPVSQFAAVSMASQPRSFEPNGPVVHLRNEAPRAIGAEARSPISIRRLPPVDVVQTAAPSFSNSPPQVASVWNSPPTSFNDPATSAATYAASTPATPASFANTPPESAGSAQPTPPPFIADASDDSQTHIVADGDSLEKLASLYLSDPHRGKEIFELNRDILSDPNLLPIGAELKIPDRIARASADRQSRLPGFRGDQNVREAAMGNLVPVRALPSVPPPQAQLTHPVAAD
jgi:nucleoid-associated protein YgaU